MSALTEYQPLKSIKERLEFDASGRPGVVAVRELQQTLQHRNQAYHRQAINNINSQNSPFRYSTTRERKHHYMMRCLEAAHSENDQREGSPRSMLGIPSHSTSFKRLGSWFYCTLEFEDKQWNVYSKAWHKRYGPKIVTTRYVRFARMFRGKPKVINQQVSGWRGDYVYAAALEAGIIKPVKSKFPLSIRLKSAYDAKLISTRRGYSIYSRTLLGTHIDYVITAPMGTTYHGTDKQSLLHELHNKMRKQHLKLTGQLIDWAECRKLGFCKPGIAAFCDSFGISIRAELTPQELETIVRDHPGRATPYMAELKVLANAYNYTTTWS